MPSRDKDQFVDAVKPALESLLSDLQRTTEVLRRHHTKPSDRDRDIETQSHTAYKGQRFDTDLEPIYQEQNVSKSSREHDAASRGSSRHDLRSSSAQRDPSQLDSMLGNLQMDMAAHGVHTIPKGDCASCGKSIIGQVVIALGKMWHPEHFNCCQCGEEIGHRNFFERAGKAYCENDYHDLFSPRCAYCNGPIRDRCVSALGKTFHADHFVCHACGRPFGDEGFHEKDGVAYCREDFFARYAPKCKGCDKPIRSKFITALNTHWHPECFTCQECGSHFDGGSFFDHNGRPLCETHYHEKRGSLCHHCKKPISGRCVSAMGHKFHPDHFCCVYCNRQLCRGTFKEANGRPFCHKCYNKINSS